MQPVSSSVSTFLGVGYQWGSSQMTAGLAFVIMAWLIDFLALLLAILCVVETTNSVLSSRKLLSLERMPATLFCVVVAIIFRIIGVACGYNAAIVQTGSTGPFQSLQAAYPLVSFNNTISTNAAPILLIIAIIIEAIGAAIMGYAVYLARAEPPKTMPGSVVAPVAAV